MIKIARIVFLTALLAGAPAAWADDDQATVVSALVIAAKPHVTPLSGVDVVARRKASPTAVSGVDVSPPNRCLPPRREPDRDVPAPTLVSTYPARGQVVRPGLLVVRLTFDLPMACRGAVGVSFFRRNPCSPIDQTWVLSFDRKTLRILCTVAPKTRYGLWFNHNAMQDFQGLGGRKPGPYELDFDTSDEAAITAIPEAVAQDPALAPAKP